MADHSSIPPSSLGRVLKCPASLRPNAEKSEDSNDAALEGTTAHWWAEQTLNGVVVPVGTVCPETHMEVTEDMVHYTQVYVDHARWLMATQHMKSCGIEKRVKVPQIHNDCWGTLDFFAWNGALYVVDLKYGYRIIEPVDNTQLMTYARGIANELELPDTIRVVLTIVQPRAWHRLGPVREYCTTLAEIDTRIAVLNKAVINGMSDTPTMSTGSHCMYCVKAVDCEALNHATYNAIDVAMISGNECDFENKHLSLTLENLEKAQTIIDIRKNALSARALDLIKEGQTVPGYEASPTFSRRTWSKSDDEMKAMGTVLGINMTKEVISSPSEAKKAGMADDIMKKLSSSNKSGVKLTRDNNNLARMIFSKEV